MNPTTVQNELPEVERREQRLDMLITLTLVSIGFHLIELATIGFLIARTAL